MVWRNCSGQQTPRNITNFLWATIPLSIFGIKNSNWELIMMGIKQPTHICWKNYRSSIIVFKKHKSTQFLCHLVLQRSQPMGNKLGRKQDSQHRPFMSDELNQHNWLLLSFVHAWRQVQVKYWKRKTTSPNAELINQPTWTRRGVRKMVPCVKNVVGSCFQY